MLFPEAIFMDMTNKEYGEYVKKKMPRSPLWGDVLRALVWAERSAPWVRDC